jgi:arylsulfatase
MGGMVHSGGDIREKGPYQGYLNDSCVTLAEVLGSAGYNTLMSGKWHVGESHPHWPCDRGFDRYKGIISGGANYFDYTKGKRPGIVRRFAIDNEAYTPPTEDFYLTDWFSKSAVSMIESQRDEENPFFMYLAYTAPHWPLHAWEEDIEKYRGTYMHGWDELRKRRKERLLELGIIDGRWDIPPRDPECPAWDSIDNKEEMDLKMAIYAAQINRMDQGIGQVLAQLESIGKADDTLVLFLSDNGGCWEGGPMGFDFRQNGLPPGGPNSYMSYGQSWANASNTPFRYYKHWVHEGGIATPLIARWPNMIEAGRNGQFVDARGHVIDFMATFSDLAGATYPATYGNNSITQLEGRSFAHVLGGDDSDYHDLIFWEHEGNKALSDGVHKLVTTDNGNWELYNLEKDRTEMHNLISTIPSKADEMKDIWYAWADKVGARYEKDGNG